MQSTRSSGARRLCPSVNQQHEFGLRKKVPLTGLGSMVEDELELPNQTPEAAEGVISYLAYCLCLDTPANNAFKTSYEACQWQVAQLLHCDSLYRR